MIHHISPYTPLSPTAVPYFWYLFAGEIIIFNYLISNTILEITMNQFEYKKIVNNSWWQFATLL